MIVHDYKTIFIHVPKTGGTSIENFFVEMFGLNPKTDRPVLLLGLNYAKVGPLWLGHLTAEEYYKLHFVSKEIFDNYYKFAFVRNPWMRAVSSYKSLNYDLAISFRTYVKVLLPILYKNFMYDFVKPQYKFLCNEKDEIIVDFLGRFENLKEDFKKVCKRLNIENDELPFHNKTERMKGFQTVIKVLKFFKRYPKLVRYYGPDKIKQKDYRLYYDDELKAEIARIYKKDIEMFGYTFDN